LLLLLLLALLQLQRQQASQAGPASDRAAAACGCHSLLSKAAVRFRVLQGKREHAQFLLWG
jgi:hypothetical protein